MDAYPQSPAGNFPETVGASPGSNWLNSVRAGLSYAPSYFTRFISFGGDWSAFYAGLALGTWMTPPYRDPQTDKIYQIFCYQEAFVVYHGTHWPYECHDYTDLRLIAGDYYCRDTPIYYVDLGSGGSYTNADPGPWKGLRPYGDGPNSKEIIFRPTSTCEPYGNSAQFTHTYTWEIAQYRLLWYTYDDTMAAQKKPPSIIPSLVGCLLLAGLVAPAALLPVSVSLMTSGSASPTPGRRRRKY